MAKKKEFDVKGWLDEVLKDGEVPEDKRKVIDEIFTSEKVATKTAASAMRLNDYSSKQDELRTARDEFDEERKRAKQEHSDRLKQLAEWEGNAKQTLAEEQKAKQELAQQLEAANRKYRKAIKASGLDDDDLDDDDDALPPAARNNGVPAGFDPEKFWSEKEKALRAEIKKEFEQGASDLVKMIGPYPVRLMHIASEHQKLFGEPVDMDALYRKHLETEKPIDEIWAHDYKVAERRAEIEEEALNKRLEDAREEGRRTAIEEMSKPQIVEPDRYASPALKKFAAKPENDPGDGLTAVDRAVIAHREHKHAPPGSPHWKGHQQANP